MATLPDQKELQDLLVDLSAKHKVVGSSAAVRNGSDFVEAAQGIINLRTGVEVTTDSLFQIGSTTKVYTATLVMQLVAEGKFGLDDPVESLIEGLQFGADPTARAVTVRQLLAHTSGVLGDHYDDYGRGDEAIPKCTAVMGSFPQIHPVGEMMAYCNAGYIVLGRLIEVFRGVPFHTAMTEHLLKPLGCDYSAATPEEALLFRTAAGHIPNPANKEESMVVPRWDVPGANEPAGGLLCCSARDVTTFAQMHIDRGKAADGTQVLAEEAVEQMQVSQVDLPPGNALAATGWGLGWVVKEWSGRKVVGHNGDTLGQHAFLWVVPEEGVSLALLTNSSGAHPLFRDLAEALFPKVAGVTPTPQPTPLEDISGIDIEPMLGTFENPNATVEITRGDNGLTITQRSKLTLPTSSNEPVSYPAHVIDGSRALIDMGVAQMEMGFFGPDDKGRYEWLHYGARVVHRVA